MFCLVIVNPFFMFRFVGCPVAPLNRAHSVWFALLFIQQVIKVRCSAGKLLSHFLIVNLHILMMSNFCSYSLGGRTRCRNEHKASCCKTDRQKAVDDNASDQQIKAILKSIEHLAGHGSLH
jgi:hypothetical protein